MRKIMFLFIAAICVSCQEKDEINRPADIQGSWYGIVGKNPWTGDDQQIRLDLEYGRAEISTYFVRNDRGWHDAIGTYTYDGKDTIWFNIDMGECEFTNQGKNTITHAIVEETASVYEAGKNETVLRLYFDRINSYGEFSQEYIWLSRRKKR